MNQTALIGRFVRPIKLIQVAGDKQVVNNTLAVTRHRHSETGPTADFIPIVFWGKTADLVAHYCHKGSRVGVSGHLVSRSYTNKQEQQVYVVECICEEVSFLEHKSDDGEKPAKVSSGTDSKREDLAFTTDELKDLTKPLFS